MKALTVRQPWAWAIIHGGKDVENRNWSPKLPPSRFAIHAAQAVDLAGLPTVAAIMQGVPTGFTDRGAIIGTVALVECHMPHLPWGRWAPCVVHGCERWGQDDVLSHWVLTDPRPCAPIPIKGKLGLWELPDDVAARLS